MALIVILFGTLAGSLVALTQLLFLGADFGTAVATYFAIALGCAICGLAAASLRPDRRSTSPAVDNHGDEIEAWLDWQIQEDMNGTISASVEAERTGAVSRKKTQAG